MKSSIGGIVILIEIFFISVLIINASYFSIVFTETNKINIPKPKYEIINNQIIYGYSSTVDQTDSDPFTTASMQKVREGIIANNCYPFGTRIKINDKVYEVQDRMNDRYGCNVWDIWFATKQQAKEWGKRILIIKVYETI